jgi:rhodanese-related sulfurtransferase
VSQTPVNLVCIGVARIDERVSIYARVRAVLHADSTVLRRRRTVQVSASRSIDCPPIALPLAIYCRSGPMSATAAATLHDLGFHNIVGLRGGMRTWQADGRPLIGA